MYLSYIVIPILEYGDVIRDTQTSVLVNKIEKVQLEAARIVTGDKVNVNSKFVRGNGQEKLSDRREKHKSILLQKIVNNDAPGYLQNLLPDRVANRHSHNNHQSSSMTEKRTKTKFYSDYFLPSSIKFWNNLPQSTRNSKSLNNFKNQISKPNSKFPCYYQTGTQILHSKLRMNSNLHLFARNLVCSLNCACDHVESTSQYLFYFNRYSDIGNEFIYTINYPVRR